MPLSSAGAVAAAGVTDEEKVSVLSVMGMVAEESISEGCRESTFIKGDEGLVRSGLSLCVPTNQQQYTSTRLRIHT